MRIWRVGTFSMGTALLLLGVLLFLSNFNKDVTPFLLSWWPFIFIVLGLEIIVHLFMRKEENPVIKYDVFSIFFIAILGTVGLVFASVDALGITDEVHAAITNKEMTLDLPEHNLNIANDIKNIVVEDSYHSMTIESSPSNEVLLFGTYRTSMGEGNEKIIQPNDFASIKTIGDTLYISLKELPRKIGWNSDYVTTKVNLVIPSDVKLEVRGRSDNLILRPNSIENNWFVEDASQVSVYVKEEDDLAVQVLKANHLQTSEQEWEEVEELSDDYLKGNIKLGEGKNKVEIIQAYEVSAYVK